MSGQDDINNLQQAGFSPDEISQWQAKKSGELLSAGFSQDEVNSYWGIKKPNDDAIRATFENNLKAHVDANKNEDGSPKPLTMQEALAAGWGMGTTSLAITNKMPDKELTGNESWGARTAYSVAQAVNDIPASVAGFVLGAGAGAETGPGALAFGVGGASALPTALRATMIDAMKKGEFKTFGDFMDRASGILVDTAKSWVTGAATGAVGGKVAQALPIKSPVAATAATFAAETATMANVSAALDGHVAGWQEYVDAGTMLAAMKVGVGGVKAAAPAVKSAADHMTDKLADLYKKTGVQPEQVMHDIQSDPTIMQDLASANKGVPRAYESMVDPMFKAKEEPAPNTGMAAAYRGVTQPWSEAARGDIEWWATTQDHAAKYASNGDVVSTRLDLSKYTTIKETDYNIDKLNAEYTKAGVDGVRVVDDEGKTVMFASFNKPGIESKPAPGTPEAAQKAILDKIQVGGESTSEKMTLDRLYTLTLDDFNPIKNAVDQMAGGKEVPASEDPYILARTSRGVYGKAVQWLEHSPFEFGSLENTGKSFKSIVEPMAKDLDGFRAYLAANRAVELEGRGIKSGLDLEAAKQVVANGGKYEQAAKDLIDYQDNLTKYLRDSGVLSKEAYAAMREANKSYVPFYRVMDEGAGGPGVAKGLKTANPVKGIKGSERDIIDPLESVIKNTYTYLTLADRNAIGKAFVDLANKSGAPEEFIEKQPPLMRASEVSEKEMNKFLAANGIEGVPKELLTIFRSVKTPLRDNEIAVFEDGKRSVYEVDPEVGKAFNAVDKEGVNALMKILAEPARILRAGATLAPDFMVRNVVRDQITAFSFSKNGFIPVYDTLRGAMELFNKGEDFQNWLKSGGANSTLVALDRQYIQSELFKLVGENKDANFLDKTWNLAKKPIDYLRITSELFENATRLGEFKRAMSGEQGKDAVINAGYNSREVTLDFARIGAKMRAMNAITAFFNAQVQGVDRAVRAFQDNPLGTTAKVAAAITLPSVLLWAAQHDDDWVDPDGNHHNRWEEIPSWQRDLFWVVFVGDHVFRIPKPFELGIIFGSGVERALDAVFANGDSTAAQDFLKTMGGGVLPNFIPTAAQPVLEHISNYSFLNGHALVPDHLMKGLPEYRYSDYTSEFTKSIGHVLGQVPYVQDTNAASPIVIDNYVRAWTGGLGAYAMQMADAGLRKAGVLPDPVKPLETLADIPVVKAFVIRYPSANVETLQRFRDTYQKESQVYVTVQRLMEAGDVDSALRIMNTEDSMNELADMNKTIGDQSTLIHMIYQNPEIRPDEKRQLIDSAYYNMITIAQQGNDLAKEVHKALHAQ